MLQKKIVLFKRLNGKFQIKMNHKKETTGRRFLQIAALGFIALTTKVLKTSIPNMKYSIILVCFALLISIGLKGQQNNSSNKSINAYYTRLPFNDFGYTGKYADIIVELPEKGNFVFSREYSYQPFWQANGKKLVLVDRLIPRKGDGPKERPDKHNICSNASIVGKTETTITVHWRYAPDLTKPSFVDFRSAYNKAGNPSPFYGEYADEYFTIHANGKVVRTVKKGCYKLGEWNDPRKGMREFRVNACDCTGKGRHLRGVIQ